MSLFEQWKELTKKERSQAEHEKFWTVYLAKETKIYEHLLEHHEETSAGSLSELASGFGMDLVEFAGFLDGINTSLIEMLPLEEMTEDSQIKLEIDLEKLYYNMLAAKAEWLYNLPQWNGIQIGRAHV